MSGESWSTMAAPQTSWCGSASSRWDSLKKALQKSQYPLIGFGGKRIEALGKIELNVMFGEGATQRTEAITFGLVDINYPYNAIFARNTLVKFAAVIHQSYLYMKLPSAGGVATVFGN